jgi:hypothetical protein
VHRLRPTAARLPVIPGSMRPQEVVVLAFWDRLHKSAFNQQHMCQGVSGESLGDEQIEAHNREEA